MILLWAGLCPGLAFTGCAWSIGAPAHAILVAGVSGLLAGLTGGGIVLQHCADEAERLARRIARRRARQARRAWKGKP